MSSKSKNKRQRKYSDSSEEDQVNSDHEDSTSKKISKYSASSSESDYTDSDDDYRKRPKSYQVASKKRNNHSRREDRDRSRSSSGDRDKKKSKSHRHHEDRDEYHRSQSSSYQKTRYDNYKKHNDHDEEKHQNRHGHDVDSENRKYKHRTEYHRKNNERDTQAAKRGDGNNPRKNDDRHRNRNSRSRSRSFDHVNAKWGKGNANEEEAKKVQKEKPNFGLSGKLTEERNTYRGVVIKYSEPPEARKPKRRWRLYPFKGEKALQTLYIHRESGYLIGRERKVVDIPVDHPSCSKQHAALQYRLVTFTREDGTTGKRVRPYIIDLDSANGTYINNKRIEPRKYVELLEKDVIKFGYSSREYVLLHENSKDETQDDDVKDEVIVKEED